MLLRLVKPTTSICVPSPTYMFQRQTSFLRETEGYMTAACIGKFTIRTRHNPSGPKFTLLLLHDLPSQPLSQYIVLLRQKEQGYPPTALISSGPSAT